MYLTINILHCNRDPDQLLPVLHAYSTLLMCFQFSLIRAAINLLFEGKVLVRKKGVHCGGSTH